MNSREALQTSHLRRCSRCPAEAIFLDAQFDSELAEPTEEDRGCGLGRVWPGQAGTRRLRHPGLADLPDRRPEGNPSLNYPQGMDRPAGRRCHPHRLPARLHQGRVGRVRRPCRYRILACGQGPHRRQKYIMKVSDVTGDWINRLDIPPRCETAPGQRPPNALQAVKPLPSFCVFVPDASVGSSNVQRSCRSRQELSAFI